MDLQDILSRFDGKHVDELRDAAESLDARDIPALVDACSSHHAVAATWLIKNLLERGRTFDLSGLFHHLSEDQHWEAQLHLLQSVRHAGEEALVALPVMRNLIGHKKTLVRVWALDALIRMHQIDPALLPEAMQLLEKAERDKAASLRARARNLRAEFGL